MTRSQLYSIIGAIYRHGHFVQGTFTRTFPRLVPPMARNPDHSRAFSRGAQVLLTIGASALLLLLASVTGLFIRHFRALTRARAV
jgi:hypothetical protein